MEPRVSHYVHYLYPKTCSLSDLQYLTLLSEEFRTEDLFSFGPYISSCRPSGHTPKLRDWGPAVAAGRGQSQ